MKEQPLHLLTDIYVYYFKNYVRVFKVFQEHLKNIMIVFLNKDVMFFQSMKLILHVSTSGGELLEMRLLDSHLLDTFGSKSIARHKFYQLLESS
jgi:hypothetical protein